MEEDIIKKAFDLWSGFKDDVLYNNRYFLKHEVLDYLKHILEKCRKKIEKGEILYRARIYQGDELFLQYINEETNKDESNKKNEEILAVRYYKALVNYRKQTGFWGYEEKGSFVPSENNIIGDGRVNPSFIKYLYTAEDPYTALVEVRPYLNSKVSVAEIKVNEQLLVADFSYESSSNLNGFEQYLMLMIMRDFAKPSDNDKKNYIPIQYIAEYVKTLGVDGIRFNSSLHSRGKNITIFNYEKCKAVGSKLYSVDDICFEAKAVAPLNEKSLVHYKLEPYRIKRVKEILDSLTASEKVEN
jgi:hypothetical protein